jgi:hypothetical protein
MIERKRAQLDVFERTANENWCILKMDRNNCIDIGYGS